MGGGSGDDLASSVRRARDDGGWDSLIQGPTDISVFEPKGGQGAEGKSLAVIYQQKRVGHEVGLRVSNVIVAQTITKANNARRIFYPLR